MKYKTKIEIKNTYISQETDLDYFPRYEQRNPQTLYKILTALGIMEREFKREQTTRTTKPKQR